MSSLKLAFDITPEIQRRLGRIAGDTLPTYPPCN